MLTDAKPRLLRFTLPLLALGLLLAACSSPTPPSSWNDGEKPLPTVKIQGPEGAFKQGQASKFSITLSNPSDAPERVFPLSVVVSAVSSYDADIPKPSTVKVTTEAAIVPIGPSVDAQSWNKGLNPGYLSSHASSYPLPAVTLAPGAQISVPFSLVIQDSGFFAGGVNVGALVGSPTGGVLSAPYTGKMNAVTGLPVSAPNSKGVSEGWDLSSCNLSKSPFCVIRVSVTAPEQGLPFKVFVSGIAVASGTSTGDFSAAFGNTSPLTPAASSALSKTDSTFYARSAPFQTPVGVPADVSVSLSFPAAKWIDSNASVWLVLSDGTEIHAPLSLDLMTGKVGYIGAPPGTVPDSVTMGTPTPTSS